MRGDGENFNKAAEHKETGAAVPSFQSPCLMNLGWRSPRAGSTVASRAKAAL